MKDIQFQQLNKQFEFIARKISAHDEGFVKIDNQFEQVNEQLELIALTLSRHNGNFLRIDQRFDKMGQRLDKVVDAVMNHEHRLSVIEENMATKEDIKGLIGIIDHWGKSIQDIKVDHTFSVGWLTRMQEQLGWHEQDIKKLKLMLNLA